MKVALVHDWLVSNRGGEKVLEELCKIYPEAPIYTLFYDKNKVSEFLKKKDIRYSSNLNRFKRVRKVLLPLLPLLVENITLWNYDLVISTSSCVAKGVITQPGSTHICYIHSPMRYIWDQSEHYFKTVSKIPILNFIAKYLLHKLRIWDVTSSSRVSVFVANSHFVANRVKSYYNRKSFVVFPPVPIDKIQQFIPSKISGPEYYVVAGAFVPYKKFELAIEACNHLQKRLIVMGSGPLERELRKIKGSTIEFNISPKHQEWFSILSQAKAFIFPAVEDFGIIAIEAMAVGTPVIALKKGGALDFVIPQKTGIFFEKQSSSSLSRAIKEFESINFNKEEIKKFSKKFSSDTFKHSIRTIISDNTERLAHE